MSVHIEYRFLKETEDYEKNPERTRGYTVVEANYEYPFNRVLKDFYQDIQGKAVQIFNIKREA
jgi:hypothetical protein